MGVTSAARRAVRAKLLEGLEQARAKRDLPESQRKGRSVGRRLVLIIGSQCPQMGQEMFSFLPRERRFDPAQLPDEQRLVFRLRDYLADGAYGGCEALALSEEILYGDLNPDKVDIGYFEDGLLVNPDIAAADNALRSAMQVAHQAQAVLILMYVGHGMPFPAPHGRQVVDFQTHYLQPWNAAAEPTSPATGWNMLGTVAQYRAGCDATGIIALVDACFASSGLQEVAKWIDPSGRFRFSMLGSSADTNAYDACFSRELLALMEDGSDRDEQLLDTASIAAHVQALCANQVPLGLSTVGGETTTYGESGLWLVRNRRVTAGPQADPLAGSATYDHVRKLVTDFVVPPWLEDVVAATSTERCVAVRGGTGSGKSALAAALHQAQVTDGVVPEGFVHAIGFIPVTPTPEDLAIDLGKQLVAGVDGFAQASQLHHARNEAKWDSLDVFHKQVIGPLQILDAEAPVRIVVDGLDHLRKTRGGDLISTALEELATAPDLDALRLVVTGRPEDSTWPSSARFVDLGSVPEVTATLYLAKRSIGTPRLQGEMVTGAAGSWLLLRLLADVEEAKARQAMGPAGDEPIDEAGGLVAEAYATLIAGATHHHDWDSDLAPLLSVLAAAPVGPVLPMQLLYVAVSFLGGPENLNRLLALLTNPSIQPLVDRALPGTDEEKLGLFHSTLAEYLMSADGGYRVPAELGHGAIAEAIESLAPWGEHDHTDPLHEYAEWWEPAHRWLSGDAEAAVDALVERRSPIPAENLYMLEGWLPHVVEQFGEDGEQALRVMREIAHFTGAAGRYRQAAEMFSELAERTEGGDAVFVDNRREQASWLIEDGRVESLKEALTQLSDLISGVLADWPPEDLHVRQVNAALARCYMALRRDREALALYRTITALEEDRDDTDPAMLIQTVQNIAILRGRLGDAPGALSILEELREQVAAHEPEASSVVFQIDAAMAEWTGRSGDSEGAVQRYLQLVPRMEEALGTDHPRVLRAYGDLASAIGYAGRPVEAANLLMERREQVEETFGTDHPQYLGWMVKFGHWVGDAGRVREARDGLTTITPMLEQALWPTAPEVLKARVRRARYMVDCGDYQEALDEFRALEQVMTDAFGPDHPDVLELRNEASYVVGLVEGTARRLELRRQVLAEVERVLGSEHPEAIVTRCNIAEDLGVLEGPQRALELYADLRPKLEAVRGPHHPDTMRMRFNMISWRTRGDASEIRQAYEELIELLGEQREVLPEDNVDVIRTRLYAANALALLGQTADAIEVVEPLVGELEEVIGPDHQYTFEARLLLANYYLWQGDVDEARRRADDIRADAVTTFGEGSPTVEGVDVLIGAVAAKSGG